MEGLLPMGIPRLFLIKQSFILLIYFWPSNNFWDWAFNHQWSESEDHILIKIGKIKKFLTYDIKSQYSAEFSSYNQRMLYWWRLAVVCERGVWNYWYVVCWKTQVDGNIIQPRIDESQQKVFAINVVFYLIPLELSS